MFKEFKEFAVKGNVIDLAVGVIIGGAFGKIVDSMVGDLIMPMVSALIGRLDFSNLFIALGAVPAGTGATLDALRKAGVPVLAFRISYVGEQGWELHFKYEDGLALWDALFAQGVTPVGVETYANSRRMEKSLRLQNGDLLTEYNLMECDLARPKVKAADFHGKEAHLAFREREHQPAYLCTLTMAQIGRAHV